MHNRPLGIEAGPRRKMHVQAREFARVPLSLLTRLRLILFGHEDLASIVFWATLVGLVGALASVVFRELIRLFTKLFTGYTADRRARLRAGRRRLEPDVVAPGAGADGGRRARRLRCCISSAAPSCPTRPSTTSRR